MYRLLPDPARILDCQVDDGALKVSSIENHLIYIVSNQNVDSDKQIHCYSDHMCVLKTFTQYRQKKIKLKKSK